MDSNDSAVQRLVDRVAAARNSKISLNIQGGNTKRFYGNSPRGEALDMSGLSGISSYEPTELFVTGLAGTSLAELESALSEHGQCLPFEPPHFGEGGTLGGMVAAGMSGPGRVGAGPVRDFVLGVTLVNGRGEMLTFGGQVMKNVAGYDVSRVIAGSMGILGVICEVSLKVMPIAPASRTLRVDVDEAGALQQLTTWAGAGVPITASSWYEEQLWVRLGGAKAAVGRCVQAIRGRDVDPAEAAQWWSDVRDHRHEFFVLSDAELARGERLWRLAVPDALPTLSLPGRPFIEWGGSQRWYRGTAPADSVRAKATAVGGHATLFRAADKSPGAFTTPSRALLQVHRRLKESFDPAGIFNPGRLYPDM